jgi:hypothetical protein
VVVCLKVWGRWLKRREKQGGSMTFTGGKVIFVAFISTWVAISTSLYAAQPSQSQSPLSKTPSLPIITSNPGEATLHWTAPGNDGDIGVADHYVIKYSINQLTGSNWDSATTVPNPPIPLPAGSSQSFSLGGLARGEQYYFGIKTYDGAGNVSDLSNVIRKFSGGIAAPSPQMAAVDSAQASVTLYTYTVDTAMPVEYQFALDQSASFPNPSLASDSLVDSLASVVYAGLNRGSRYYWRCRAVALDLSDSSQWSNPDSFFMPAIANDVPTVTVTAPNGGESWEIGSTHEVTWADSDDNGIVSFKIECSLDGGATWLTITDWISGDPHTYSWTLPNQVSSQARIRVSCRDALGGIGTDNSDSDFAIVGIPPVVDLTSPDGGETWNCGSVHDIAWSGNDNLGIAAYKLEYSIDAGNTWLLIRDWTNGNPEHYSWTIPGIMSMNCRAKVTLRNISGLTGFDVSRANFAITDTIAPQVTVTSPNGGEKMRGGMNRNIFWTDDDNVGVFSFKLDFSTDGGVNWFLICDWADGDPGRYSWDVPNTPSQYCRICVSVRDDAGNTSIDISDQDFLIREGRGAPNDPLIPDSTLDIIYDEGMIVQIQRSLWLSAIPDDYFLGQSYPNPFNAVTRIDYGLPEAACVSFDIFDITGRHVATLVTGYQEAGNHSLTWDSSLEPSGIYFYRLKAGEFVQTRKMTVIK